MPQLATHLDDDRADDRRIVEDLNRNYLRAAEEGDVRWYDEHLAPDFVTSSVNGSITDRAAFLRRMSTPRPGGRYEAVDVRIRFIGELALVHAGFRCIKPDGQPGSGRYTDIYAQQQGRWLCVSAHFNNF